MIRIVKSSVSFCNMVGSLSASPVNGLENIFLFKFRLIQSGLFAYMDHIEYAGSQPFNVASQVQKFGN